VLAVVAAVSLVAIVRDTHSPAGAKGPSIAVSRAVASPGTTVVATVGPGFASGERVDVYLDTTNVETIVEPSTGILSMGIGIPTRAAPGKHWLTAVGRDGGHIARASIQVRTDWAQGGFDASHAGFNVRENAVDGLSVSSLGRTWSATAPGAVAAAPAVVAGTAYVLSADDLAAFPAAGCANDPCQPTWTGRITGSAFGPAVGGNSVFVTTAAGRLLAFPAPGCDSDTCAPVWTATAGPAATVAPTVAGDVVYTGASDGTVAAFPASGCGTDACDPTWTANVGAGVTGPPTVGFATLRGHDLLFVGTTDGRVVALDASVGAKVWTVDAEGAVSGSVAYAPDVLKDTEAVYATSAQGVLTAVDAATGKVLWRASPDPGSAMSPPTVAISRVFAGSADGLLYAFQAMGCEPGLSLCPPLWSGGTAGDAPIAAQPSAAGGVVYATRGNGAVDAFDLPGCKATSCPAPLWSSGAVVRAAAPVAVSNGSVYAGTSTGRLVVFGVPGEATAPSQPAPADLHPFESPIRHVVIIYQENHSFDEVLGYACWHWTHPDAPAPEAVAKRPGLGMACDGAIQGRADGVADPIPLRKSPDVVPVAAHGFAAHQVAVNGGKMDGFNHILGCTSEPRWNYGCYTQYYPSQVPNYSGLGAAFAISDRTFETDGTSSWGAHTDLVAAGLGGFVGDVPNHSPEFPVGPGWGCDSMRLGVFIHPSGLHEYAPSCYPRKNGTGPFRPSPAQSQPTTMDRFDGAGLSWRIYEGDHLWSNSDIWSVCPTFAECLYGPQAANVRPARDLISDAKAGTLPNITYALPMPGTHMHGGTSQHNQTSMKLGDNQIGADLQALMNGPEWNSTAVFVTYDDCGCFYDHVPPPSGLGIRLPMIMISPYAKRGFTDHHAASITSMASFTEHIFGLRSLGKRDRRAYDFMKSFDFTQAPLAPIVMVQTPIPPREMRYILRHPEPDDPT
jgi:phospholipase C